MEGLIGIAVIAGFILVVYLFRKGVSRATGAIEGAVTGNTRSRGKAATGAVTHFSVPMDGPAFITALLDTLELPEQPSMRSGLFLGGVSDDGTQAIIKGGNRIATGMTFMVDTTPSPEGCTGMAATLDWMESDGLVTMTDEIERLHSYVRSLVESHGGACAEDAAA